MYTNHVVGMESSTASRYDLLVTGAPTNSSISNLLIHGDVETSYGIRLTADTSHDAFMDFRADSINQVGFRMQDQTTGNFSSMLSLSNDSSLTGTGFGMSVNGRMNAASYFVGSIDTRAPIQTGLYLLNDGNSASFRINKGTGTGGFSFSNYNQDGSLAKINMNLLANGSIQLPAYKNTENNEISIMGFDADGNWVRTGDISNQLASAESWIQNMEYEQSAIPNKMNEIITYLNHLEIFGEEQFPIAIPNPPTNVTAIAGNASAVVSFIGYYTAHSYTVIASDGTKATGLTSPITITGLTNGLSYTFTVRSTNIYGTSARSAPSNSIMLIPSAPTNVVATPGNQSASVAFMASIGASSYTVTSSSGQTATGTNSPIIVTGLTNGNSYTFTVNAIDVVGTSPSSAASASILLIPSPPTILGTSPGVQSATVSFTLMNGATSYTVTSSTGQSATSTVSPITVTGLTNGSSYTFTVVSTNSTGSSLASTPSASTLLIPSAPSKPTATPGLNSAIIAYSYTNGATSYTVTASPGGQSASSSVTPIVIGGLLSGSEYTFTITATNATGTSPASIPSTSILLISDPPVNVTAAPAYRSASVSFTPAVGAVTYYVQTIGGSQTASGSSSPIVVSNLTNGSSYAFKISSINPTGTSTPSEISNYVLLSPDPPTNLFATAGNACATVEFNLSNGATSYTITANNGITSTGSTSPILVSGLTNGNAYTFTGKATNATGTSFPSELSTLITLIPNTPTNVVATPGIQIASVAFTGTNGATLYSVTASNGTVFSGASSPIIVTGLQFGTAYTFTVAASNLGGKSSSSVSSSSIRIVPTEPTEMNVVTGNTNATVTFTPSYGASNYNLKATPYGSSSNPIVNTTGSSSPIVIGGLVNGQKYTFSLTAMNTTGSSPTDATFLAQLAPSPASGVVGSAGWSLISLAFTGAYGATSFLATASIGSIPIPNVYLPFENALTDLQGNAKASVIGSASYATGKSGTALNITPGTTITYPFNVNSLTFTLSFWYYANSTTGDAFAFTARTGEEMTMNAAGSGVYIYNTQESGWSNSSSFSLNTWYHIALVYNSRAITYYQNGSVVHNEYNMPIVQINNLVFGKTGNCNFLVDEFRVYNSSLTPTQIQSLYTARTATGTSSPITINGLVDGSTYTVSVLSSDDGGTSYPATSSSVVTLIPLTPTNVEITGGNTTASISFTPSFGATSYLVASSLGFVSGTSSPITVTGLTNGSTYSFTVSSYNNGGFSLASYPATSVTLIPNAPTLVSATAGATSASVAFTGTNGATSYTVTASDGTTATGTFSPITVSGLSKGSSYTFTVTATNAGGTSSQSASSALITLSSAPPTNVVATPGIQSASISFIGTSGATSYTVTSSDGKTAVGSSSPITVSGLAFGTSYTFTVTATNAGGTSAASAASSSIILLPAAPTNVSGSGFGTSITVSFTGSTGAATYTATASGGSYATGTTSPLTITGLTSGSTYTVSVTATNAGGTSAVSTASPSITLIPSIPSNVTATAGNETATVSFTNVAGATSYLLTRTLNGVDVSQVGLSSPIAVTGLINGNTYSFRVQSYNEGGYSLMSSSVSTTLIPNKPTLVTATAGSTTASVAFTGSNGSTTYTVLSSGGQSATGTYSPIIVSGLVPGSSYTFTVTATNGGGTSDSSVTSESITLKPLPPTNVTGISSGTTAAVSFTASDGATTYTVTSSPENHTLTGSASPITLSGLNAGQTYTFTVTATNVGGTSAASVASTAVTLVPSAPTSVTVVTGNTTATVSFLPAFGATSYTVTTAPGGLNVTGNSSPLTITGLTNGAIYTFSVTASNAAGTSSSESVSATLAPSPPTSAIATAGEASSGSASVSFTGSYGATQYTVLSSPGGISAVGVSSPIVISGLSNGSTYSFTVTASDAGGSSMASNASAAITLVPVAPTNVVVTAGNTNASVAFTGSSGATSYLVSCSGGQTTSGSASPLLVTGLTNGVAYSFTVQAYNAGGYSLSSSSVSSTLIPNTPTNVEGSANGTSVAVSFTSSTGASSYTATASPGGKTATGTSSPLTITGLTAGSAYTFSVTSTNAGGTSTASTSSSAVTLIPSPPTAVSGVASGTSVAVSFTASPGATSYTVTSNSGQTATGTSSPITVSGLTAGNTYTFTITATNAGGTSSSSIASSSVTLIPSSPTSVSGTASGTSVSVAFTGSNGATSYTVTSSGGQTATGTTSPISVSGLTAGSSYTFTVTATNTAGTSSSSTSSSSVTLVPAAPTGVSGTASGTSGIISFTASAGATSYTVTSSPGGITATGTSSPITMTGLTGSSYTFTITATNAGGTSAASTPSATVNFVPLAPTGISATTSGTNATVSFTASTGATSYTVTSSGGHTATGTASPITVSGLTAGNTYTFTVTASNAAGTSTASAASSSVTLVPDAPTNVTDSLSSPTSVIVSFTGSTGATSYTVTYSGGSNSFTGASSPITVTGLITGNTYTFTVTATNSSGTSAGATTTDTINPPVAPTNVLAKVSTTSASVNVSFNPSSGATSYTANLYSSTVSNTGNYFVVAGGGAGGYDQAGGGGAGGVLVNSMALTPGTVYNVSVGVGGTQYYSSPGGNGGNSTFGSITATGGGGGAQSDMEPSAGANGGSGGGGGDATGTGHGGPGGSGIAGQGYAGGAGSMAWPTNYRNGGGGGGAGGAGIAGAGGYPNVSGSGGIGITTSLITTSISTTYGVGQVVSGSVYFGGGGGAGVGETVGVVGAGGYGGGGQGGTSAPSTGSSGLTNTGGGGGGGGGISGSGGYGGSGVVMLSIPTANYSGIQTNATVVVNGSNTVLIWKSGTGSYTAGNTLVATVTGTTSPITFTGLTASQSYYASLYASNGVGTSSSVSTTAVTVPLYSSFSGMTFTPNGATGTTGPTSLSYSTSTYPWITSYLSVSSGIQKWTVPATRTYTFTAAGAGGGNSAGTSYVGGSGVIVSNNVLLTAGDVLWIVVGQKGLNSTNNTWGSGGGGGTFITRYNGGATNSASSYTILLVAGGGGGAGEAGSGQNAVTTTTGGIDAQGWCTAATNGAGGRFNGYLNNGANPWNGTGGGGFTGTGSNYASNGGPGNSFISGATGGVISVAGPGSGGFGGGAAGAGPNWGVGGGGGYSGGSGCGGTGPWAWACTGAGGGGSYDINGSSNNATLSGYNSGNGYVTLI